MTTATAARRIEYIPGQEEKVAGKRWMGTVHISALPEVEPLKTRPIDVVSSLSTVYVREKGVVRKLGAGEAPSSSKTYLLKTNGLTEQQKLELREQGTKIHYPMGSDTPYVEVSPLAAGYLADLASGLAGC